MNRARVKDWLLYALIAVLSLVIVLNVITAFLSLTNNRKKLGWLPFAMMCIQGESMEPDLSQGDLIIISDVPYDSLSVGDDITFWGIDGFVTHRITELREGACVTRGIANDIDDFYTVSPESYCGKVVHSVPLLGYLQQALCNSFLTVFLCAVLLLIACFARPVIETVVGRRKTADKPRLSFVVRSVAFCSMLSTLLCLPYLTEAKYIDHINRFELGVAQPVYFSSNYLSSGNGNTYNIQGWNGKPYTLKLNIRNYANSLLYNKRGIDLKFGLGVRIVTGEGLSDDYAISITPPTGVTALEDGAFNYPWTASSGIETYGAYAIAGSDDQARSSTFDLLIIPTAASGVMASKEQIQFEVFAVTDPSDTYRMELCATFRFRVADDEVKFIGEKTEQTSFSSSMINFSVKTNNVSDGPDEKIVVFSWDPEYMYINEFQSTAFSVIQKNPSYYMPDIGRLYMKMQAYSKVELEFFKNSTFSSGPNGAVVVEVVNEIGDDPVGVPDIIFPAETSVDTTAEDIPEDNP